MTYPEGEISDLLADNAMKEGREDISVTVFRLGFPGVNFSPPGLRVLVVGDRRGWTAEHIRSVQEAVPHTDWSRASFQGGHRLVAICINCRLGRGFCGAYVHALCLVHDSEEERNISCNPLTLLETVSRGVWSYGFLGLGAYAQLVSTHRRWGSIER